MKLYHGSNMEIKQPDLLRSKPFKDFGRGFYLSPIYKQAIERAKQMTDLRQEGSPAVTTFEWKEQDAISAGLSIKTFDDYCQDLPVYTIKAPVMSTII